VGGIDARIRAANDLSQIKAVDFGAFDGDYGGAEMRPGYTAFIHVAAVLQNEG